MAADGCHGLTVWRKCSAGAVIGMGFAALHHVSRGSVERASLDRAQPRV